MLLAAGSLTAQTVDMSALEACADLETPELKLACYEAIAATGTTPDEPAPEPAATVIEETAPVVEAIVTEERAPLADAMIVEEATPVVDTTVVEEIAPVRADPGPGEASDEATSRSEVADREAPVPEAVVAAEAVTPADDFGQEQLETPQPAGEKLLLTTVTEVSKGYNDALYFHLANGQVWRQIEPRYFSYPKGDEFDVTISQGMMGEYRLRIGQSETQGRMVRIRRVK